MSSILARAGLVALVLLAFACGRDPVPPRGTGVARATDASGSLPFEVLPAARADGRVERVARFLVPTTHATASDEDLVLVRGEIGPAQLRQLATGTASRALRDRMVPATVWPSDGVVALQPTAPLEAEQTYSLASGSSRSAAAVVVVDAADAAPLAALVWPVRGRSGSSALGVWCGARPLSPFVQAAALEPLGIGGAFRRGAVTDDLGLRCVRYRAGGAVIAPDALVAPPALSIAGLVLLLDPSPLVNDGAGARGDPASCDPDERAFGPGCARVEDDRLAVHAPDEPLLWAIAGEGIDVVIATDAGARFVVAPFEPERAIRLAVGTVDVVGLVTSGPFEATTGAPRPHFVLNEALADPLGAEPRQEWVEIVNDGRARGTLSGHSIADSGGAEALPDVTLEAGEVALIVGEEFVADDGVDVPPAVGTRLVRLPRLAAGGLKNGGEEVRLLGPDGRAVSRIPAEPAPKPGRSQARSRPSAPDEAASFALAEPTPGRRNGK